VVFAGLRVLSAEMITESSQKKLDLPAVDIRWLP
jgi:hypothetical protein